MLNFISLNQYHSEWEELQFTVPIYMHPTYLSAFPDCKIIGGEHSNYCIFFTFKKWGLFPTIYIPAFQQQHGLIGNWEQDELEELYLLLNKKFTLAELNQWNKNSHKIPQFSSKLKLNYELPLKQPYSELFKAYSNSHKRKLKQAADFEIEYSSSISSKEKQFIQEYLKQQSWSNKKMIRIATALLNSTFPILVSTAKQQDQIIGVCACLKFDNRLYNLFPYSNKKGKDLNCMVHLINIIIQKNSGTNMIFDFEGSVIPGVERFYKGFSPLKSDYIQYITND